MTLAELGRRLRLDKGWVSRTAEVLSQQGLLTKQPVEITINSPRLTHNLTKTVVDLCSLTASERCINCHDTSPRFQTDAIPCREMSRQELCHSASLLTQFARFFGEFLGQYGEHMRQQPVFKPKIWRGQRNNTQSAGCSGGLEAPSVLDTWTFLVLLTHILAKLAKCLGR